MEQDYEVRCYLQSTPSIALILTCFPGSGAYKQPLSKPRNDVSRLSNYNTTERAKGACRHLP